MGLVTGQGSPRTLNPSIRRAAGIYCPTCRDLTSVNGHGQCLYCDTRVLRGKAKKPAVKKGPAAHKITASLVREAYDLYLSGLSLRRVAAIVWPRTSYANATTCSVGLMQQFAAHGWKLRRRLDPVPDAQRCVAFNRRPIKTPQRCQRPSVIGSAYCYAHDPASAEWRSEHLQRVAPHR